MIGAADAADVRKCVGKAGNSYVSGTCPPGTREAWARQVVAEPTPAAAPRPSRERGDTGPARRKSSAGHGRPRRSPAQPAPERACEAAKRRRDEVRDRDWYTLTYDQLSALDRRVARACR
ncbi:MAG TPA: hypothetical protein VJ806_08770 [Luteimonas sp.]|nr:hypothetical protein [Luteimonas sp.]